MSDHALVQPLAALGSEGAVAQRYRELGFYAVTLDEVFVEHIRHGRHVPLPGDERYLRTPQAPATQLPLQTHPLAGVFRHHVGFTRRAEPAPSDGPPNQDASPSGRAASQKPMMLHLARLAPETNATVHGEAHIADVVAVLLRAVRVASWSVISSKNASRIPQGLGFPVVADVGGDAIGLAPPHHQREVDEARLVAVCQAAQDQVCPSHGARRESWDRGTRVEPGCGVASRLSPWTSAREWISR